MEVNNEGRRVLAHLLNAPDAFLFGKRMGTTPFELLDKAAGSRQPTVPNTVARETVDQLVRAGYLKSPDSIADQPISVKFVLSEEGRKKLSPL